MQDNFSHLDKDGNITMVDVGAKPDTQLIHRIAPQGKGEQRPPTEPTHQRID